MEKTLASLLSGSRKGSGGSGGGDAYSVPIHLIYEKEPAAEVDGQRLRLTAVFSVRLPYWYALHEHSIEFLKEASKAYFVLGCMDSNLAYALPLKFIESHLASLNKTEKGDRQYWHIKLQSENAKIFLNLPKVGSKVDLSSFAFAITSPDGH